MPKVMPRQINALRRPSVVLMKRSSNGPDGCSTAFQDGARSRKGEYASGSVLTRVCFGSTEAPGLSMVG